MHSLHLNSLPCGGHTFALHVSAHLNKNIYTKNLKRKLKRYLKLILTLAFLAPHLSWQGLAIPVPTRANNIVIENLMICILLRIWPKIYKNDTCDFLKQEHETKSFDQISNYTRRSTDYVFISKKIRRIF